ncbi:hypothetical protein ff3pr_01163 [Weissella cibaria]|nr:hypothetical protein ff3pr_01163 [Weissella cibaria]
MKFWIYGLIFVLAFIADLSFHQIMAAHYTLSYASSNCFLQWRWL